PRLCRMGQEARGFRRQRKGHSVTTGCTAHARSAARQKFALPQRNITIRFSSISGHTIVGTSQREAAQPLWHPKNEPRGGSDIVAVVFAHEGSPPPKKGECVAGSPSGWSSK